MIGDEPYTTTSGSRPPPNWGESSLMTRREGPGYFFPTPDVPSARSRFGLLGGAAMSRRTVTALVQLFPTRDGGRSGPLLSGYRSLLRFEGSDADFGFELELDSAVGPDGVAPGGSGTGRLSFWATEELPLLVEGQKFELREGVRIVGHGVILDPKVKFIP